MENLMDKIVSLCKRRGFIFPGSEIYGGLAGTWDLGPLGTELADNIKRDWWRKFVSGRDDMYGIKTSILMNSKVWEASGHLKSFVDPMIDCRKCKNRFRADKIEVKKGCPDCGAHDFTEARPFNMMFKTHAGPVEDTAAEVYLRPETAQGMFVNFKNILDTMRPKLPFGMAQIGRAYRNEITPGNFVFRTREFEQMEIEYFVRPPAGGKDWEKYFEMWHKEMRSWAEDLGISGISDREVPDEERAHYSGRTIDIDFDYPFGREELWGLAYRKDFDLSQHGKFSGQELVYNDEETKEKIIPHVIEPSFGLERTMLAVLLSAYHEDGDRVVLKLKPKLASHKAAVFPLVANKPQLVDKAKKIYQNLKLETDNLKLAWDDRGNIGKRYYAQDEIGTPWCVTVDYQTLEDDTVTVRDRDTARQERISTIELAGYFQERLI